jgi:hypothetical protein
MYSICKEDHAVIASSGFTNGDVCICDRCLETVARYCFIWICLGCREVYLENKRLFVECEADEDARRRCEEILSECVIRGLETCLNCCGEAAFESPSAESEPLYC